jgi:hypothetical protein
VTLPRTERESASTSADGLNPLTASLYTGDAYVSTVIVLNLLASAL